jgi:phosphoribosylamine---glycine ligase
MTASPTAAGAVTPALRASSKDELALPGHIKVLVVGGGGREHALAWKLKQSPRVSQVFVAPGNGGTAQDRDLKNIPITDVRALREWAQAEGIALTVVGPEGPLAAGVVDEFRAHGLRIFGPTRAAAQLESSKAFSKEFMQRHGIPTAAFDTFTDATAAHAYVDSLGAPIVVKADGLAAGKGVVVAMTLAEAHEAIDFMLLDNKLGVSHNEGGARVVIEEFLQGEEASFIVLCDGKNVTALATSQDHKRLLDADEGPNTGGMGAYSPAPVVTPDVHARAMREVIMPTIRGMERDGIPFTGFLYAGLMIDAEGKPKTLEFNCRMGDPETQPIMMRLKSDFAEVLWAATATSPDGPHGRLDLVELDWDRRPALGVVMAAPGYPLNPRKGDAITGLPADGAYCDDRPDAMVFHAGTTLEDGVLKTSGGRVLCVTALGDNVRQAQQRAYAALQGIHFDGMQYRKDIGHRALKT